ncbi:MAG: hypothetical protein K8S54_00830 [Spirochaetia bacterium]|nr:hypothetical protein [Spirochaetia bacterium]
MDESIQLILDSFGAGLRNYTDRLGPENKALQKFKLTYESVAKIANGCRDINELYAKANKPLAQLNDDFAALTRETPVAGIKTIPSARETAAGYHLAYQSLKNRPELVRTHALYARIFEIEKESENALAFLTRMAEENLFASMSSVQLEEEMESVRKAGETIGQPHVRAYSNGLKKALENAKSVTLTEFEGERLGLVHTLNGNFDMAYIQISARILGSISDWDTSRKEEDRAIAEHVYRTSADFYGIDFDRAMLLPRNNEFLRKNMFAKLDKASLAQKGIHSYEAWIASYRKMLFQDILKGKQEVIPVKQNDKILHLGREIPLEEIPADYNRFPFGFGEA